MESKVETRVKRPEEMGVAAYKLGCELGDFEDWLNKLPSEQRSKRGMLQMLLDSYKKGVEHWSDEHEPIDRLCIFIEDNTGKCFTRCGDIMPGVYRANTKLPLGGLMSHHKSLLVSEAFISKQLLPLTEPAVREVNKNHRWTGDLLVVVAPYGFNQWLKKCGVKFAMKQKLNDAQSAILAEHTDRFVICRYVEDELQLVKSGLDEDSERYRRYREFEDKFNSYYERHDDGFNLRVRSVAGKSVDSQAEG